MLSKLDALYVDTWRPWAYPDTFTREQTTGPERLSIACSGGQGVLLLALATELRPPYSLLYVLHTPRGGSAPGRYESPALDGSEVETLFQDFGAFWSEDARHDVWLHSHPDDATLVWDRHDLIHAYGPLASFERVLVAQGFRAGPAAHPPSPHMHNYHPEWDAAEHELVRRLRWRHTPLRLADEQ